MNAVSRILPLSLTLLVACTADEPPDHGYDLGKTGDLEISLEGIASCDGPASLAAPAPSPTPPTQYAYSILPIRGSAPGASKVGATATSGQASLVDVGSSGSFCIEVDLNKGPNQIKLFGLDSIGCPGKLSQAYPVTYTPVASPDMGSVTPANQAKGKTVTKDGNSNLSGTLNSVNDGSASTSATLSFSDLLSSKCDKCAWVKIDLGKAYTLTKFRIRWAAAAGKEYGLMYSILTAKSAPAANPDCTTNAGWAVTHSETSGVATPKDITVQPVTARWVALLMCEDAASWSISEKFQLAEFEAWGVDPGATTPPLPDRCKK